MELNSRKKKHVPTDPSAAEGKSLVRSALQRCVRMYCLFACCDEYTDSLRMKIVNLTHKINFIFVRVDLKFNRRGSGDKMKRKAVA